MAERSEGQPVAAPRRERGWVSAVTRRALRSDAAYATAGGLITAYLRSILATGRLVCEPATPEAMFVEYGPVIGTSWHGGAFLLPALRPAGRAVDAMTSRAADGEIMARILARFGFGVVRGSGAGDPSRMHEKGSVAALRALKASLDRGTNVYMTADYGRHERGKASLGLPVLSRLSQRPVMPVAIATSRFLRFGSWDQAAIPLPFSRIAFVHGKPVSVPRGASETLLEEKRQEIEDALNAAAVRAREIVGRAGG